MNQKIVKTTLPGTLAEKYITSIEKLDEIINSDPFLKNMNLLKRSKG